MRACGWLLLALVGLISSACGPTVDVTKALEVLDLSSGWYDAGLVNGQNKLVPSISFRLKNVSDQTLAVLQVNALFKRVNETDEWGSGFKTVAGSDGVGPGATTDLITIKSELGYTGTEPRLQMMQNSAFIDARVELFAKYGSVQWKKIGEFPIARRLLTS